MSASSGEPHDLESPGLIQNTTTSFARELSNSQNCNKPSLAVFILRTSLTPG